MAGGWPTYLPLNRVRAALAGADADRLVDCRDENLAVADAAGMGGRLDRLDGALDHPILHNHLDLYLGQKVDDVLGAAVKLGMSLLPAETLGLGDGDALDADLVQRLLHLVELEGLDDRLDLLHRNPFSCGNAACLRDSITHASARQRRRKASQGGGCLISRHVGGAAA